MNIWLLPFKILHSGCNNIRRNQLMLTEEMELLESIKEDQYGVYEYKQVGLDRPTEMVGIDCNQELVGEAGVMFEELRKLSIFTHVYKDIMCIHYALVGSPKNIIGLREPTYQTQEPLNKNIVTRVQQLLRQFDVKLSIQMSSAIVFRDKTPLVRYSIISIQSDSDFFSHSYQLTDRETRISKVQSLPSLPSQIKQEYILSHKEKLKNGKRAGNHLMISIQKLFVKYSLQSSANQLETNQSDRGVMESKSLIRAKDREGNYSKQPLRREKAIFDNIFNPYCEDVVYDPKHDATYLYQKESKYHNYFHFKSNVEKLNSSKPTKVIEPHNMIRKVEIVLLTFDLEDLFRGCIIETPARGEFCQHMGFYQLRVLYESKRMSEFNEEYFVCPICERKLTEDKILILTELEPILSIARYHEGKNQYGAYRIFLEIDHSQQTINYCYEHSSVDKQSQVINKLYDKLSDPVNHVFHPSIYYIIRNDPKFIQNSQ